jgi:DNA-binding beta-propeller fold protein YncE
VAGRVAGRGRRPLSLLIIIGLALLAAVAGVAAALFPSRPAAVPLPLRLVTTTPLPGGSTRFDYADVDAAAHRLFAAHMGDGVLLELDTGSGAVTATVPDLPTVTGVIVVPALHRVFTSVAGAGQVVTVDEDTATVLARTPAGRFPDGLAYVPSTGQVWVSDEAGGAEIVLDARTGQAVATVPLDGEAGNVRYDPGGDRVLVDVQTANEVAVIDPHRRTVVNRVRVPGCDHDHGLLVVDRRAFVACDGNATLIALTLAGLTELGRLDVGDDPDVLAADPDRGLLYVAAESGVVTTVELGPPAGRVTGRAHLADGAHVVAVDRTTGRAYFPVPDTGDGRPGLLITEPTAGRPSASAVATR